MKDISIFFLFLTVLLLVSCKAGNSDENKNRPKEEPKLATLPQGPENGGCPCPIVKGDCPCDQPAHLGSDVVHQGSKEKMLGESKCVSLKNKEATIRFWGWIDILHESRKDSVKVKVSLLENGQLIQPNLIDTYTYKNYNLNTQKWFSIGSSVLAFGESHFLDEGERRRANSNSPNKDTLRVSYFTDIFFTPKTNSTRTNYKNYDVHFNILEHEGHTHTLSILDSPSNSQAKRQIGKPSSSKSEHKDFYEFKVNLCTNFSQPGSSSGNSGNKTKH